MVGSRRKGAPRKKVAETAGILPASIVYSHVSREKAGPYTPAGGKLRPKSLPTGPIRRYSRPRGAHKHACPTLIEDHIEPPRIQYTK